MWRSCKCFSVVTFADAAVDVVAVAVAIVDFALT